MRKLDYVLLGAIVLVVGWSFVSSVSLAPSSKLGNAPLTNYSVTNSSSTCASTITQILSANSAIQYRAISAASGSVYLWFNSTSTGMVTQTGYFLPVNNTLVMSDANGTLWTGNIYCIPAAGTSTVATIQF